MKPKIHPKYYEKAEIVCACGNKIVVGSTVPKMHTEICAVCHPIFSGKEKLVDKTGRIERFKARLAKTEKLQKKKK